MALIHFDGAAYSCSERESVLECLERHGKEISSSCRSGVCQSCILRCVDGCVPDVSKKELSPALQQQGHFLSCVCQPTEDISVVRAGSVTQHVTATIDEIVPLNETILRLRLTPSAPFTHAAGQFANIVRPGGIVRSYSLASVPGIDPFLEFHIALMPSGKVSAWLSTEAAIGDSVEISGPLGRCYYLTGAPEQPLLLAGTGTGLAPLYGILRDALRQGHSGPIHLFHGALLRKGLYLVDELRALARDYANVTYTPCVLNDDGMADGVTVGAIDALVRNHKQSYAGWRAYLCGHPDTVRALQRKIFLAGAALKDIAADAFLPSATKTPLTPDTAAPAL